MIQNAVKYVHDLTLGRTRPWLVVGKGPTADRLGGVDLAAYNVLTLNHACLAVHRRLGEVAVAHFVDLEAFDACGVHLAQTETAACLPWYPHRNNKAQAVPLKMLADLVGDGWHGHPLTWLLAKDKLLSYNASTAPRGCRPNPRLVGVRLRHFGAVGAFNLLAAAGVRAVHSIGVDGGTGYATGFDPADRLANGRTSFDIQFPEIERTVKAHKMEWRRL